MRSSSCKYLQLNYQPNLFRRLALLKNYVMYQQFLLINQKHNLESYQRNSKSYLRQN
ncbi:hypothetical protein RNAN_1521 [Rheinheimera nanhaiensis E407-8]|uniref:Uncharacterized protein n=1 Tax=Rheinheimera nanhaiensis E407-8 TaxID=562729 RepID=I1DWX0_9GAMM|nr:hypothetical protein RNAN_1521 [Rheinheimera nanhaiensis E407-8]